MDSLDLILHDTPPIVVAISPQFTLPVLNSLFSLILIVKLKIQLQYYKHYCIYVNTFKQVFQSCSVFAWVFFLTKSNRLFVKPKFNLQIAEIWKTH